jgi:hypothetical protein
VAWSTQNLFAVCLCKFVIWIERLTSALSSIRVMDMLASKLKTSGCFHVVSIQSKNLILNFDDGEKFDRPVCFQHA